MSKDSRVSRSAQKEKPKRPLNPNFKFRSEFLKTLAPDVKHRNERAMVAFDDLSDKERDKMQKEYEKELQAFDDKMKAWKKKFNILSPSKKEKKAGERTKDKSKSK